MITYMEKRLQPLLLRIPRCGLSLAFFLCTVEASALPVRITLFTARYNGVSQVINLHWVTAMEVNNEHFVIERSLDSLHFVTVGKANSVGESHTAQHYYFDDPHPVGGKLYYRLREIDSDGKQYLTAVVSAEVPVTRLELTGLRFSEDGKELNFAIVSPQASPATVLVADIRGRVLKSFSLRMKEGANLKSIYTGDLHPGIYFLQVNDKSGGGSRMEKFSVARSPEEP